MNPIVIETERLQLREMDFSNISALAKMLQDEKVMYAYNGAFSDEETNSWMKRQISRYQNYGFGLWGVFLKDTKIMIGQCGITMQELNGAEVPEIGYIFSHAFWHKGYAIEAAKACKIFGYKSLHFPYLYSIIRDTNLASQAVALRNGMKAIDTVIKLYRGEIMPHIVFRTE